MKKLKKIGSILMAAVMTMALSATALAAGSDDPVYMTDQGGVIGEFSDPANAKSQGDTLVIYKEILAINPSEETTQVYAPTISFGYEITPEEGGQTITDAQGVQAQVKEGITGATITESVAWTTEEKLNTSAEGASNRKEITVDFSKVNWPGAGVYRYKITETAPDYAASGVTQGDSSHVRYLDVYIRDAAEGFDIYGYVCFSVNDSSTSGSESAAQKTEGFVDTSDSTGTSNKAADKYYTYDLEITKTVKNDRAMENHKFPFTVTFTPAEDLNADNIKLATAVSNDASIGNGYAGALSADSPKIPHSGSVKYIGIPYGTSVSILEMNDVIGTTYKVTSTGADTNFNEAAVIGTANGTATSKTADIKAQAINGLAAKTVAVTNEMVLISPTGVALRVAPYVMMMAAGAMLLIIARRRRAEAEG